MEKSFTVKYHLFTDKAGPGPQDAELIEAAKDAALSSYSPYSGLKVGAAVRLENGTIVKGSNQENIAYPSGMCAERVAMFAAGSRYPGVAQRSIALAAYDRNANPVDFYIFPCGACRQVMAEYQELAKKPMSVLVHSAGGTMKFDSVNDLLPFAFNDHSWEKQ